MTRISFWTCAFLVLLRVCIGWHFAYEGASKVKSAYAGKNAGDKVFTSEGYFRESEGPFGKLVKSRMVDPDKSVIEQVTLKPADEGVGPTALARFPDSLAREWDAYLDRFSKQYKLDEAQQAAATKVVNDAKAKYVLWAQGVAVEPGAKGTFEIKWVGMKVKRKAPGVNNASADFEIEVTPQARAQDLARKNAQIRDRYETMREMGKDVDVLALRADKAEATAIREELRKEVDDHTKAVKDNLAKLLDARVTAFSAKIEPMTREQTLLAMLVPMADGKNPLAGLWDGYTAYVKEFAPDLTDEKRADIDNQAVIAKARFDRWLADKDMFTGQPLGQTPVADWKADYEAWSAGKGRAEELALLMARLQADLKTQTDAMRTLVGAPLLGEERAKGYAVTPDERYVWVFPKDWSVIDYMDWSTRWFLLVVGILLMVGLFTRLSCFSAAVFLVLTVLTQPSLPWLPASPMNEGSYLFVNKNVIELVALLALMTTRSGHWFGLDAIVGWAFGRRSRAATRDPHAVRRRA